MPEYGMFGGLKGFFGLGNKNGVFKPNISFTSFNFLRLSSLLLLACSLLTTSEDLFGESIHCNLDVESIELDLFESYCFMANTFTIEPNSEDDGSLQLHRSVGPGLGEKDKRNTSQAYYQWVSLVLVLQAGLSYLPWLAWKRAEGGRVGRLLNDLHQESLTVTPMYQQVENVANFLIRNQRWFDGPALKLLVAQAACLFISILQLLIMDVYLGYRFLALGTNLFNYSALLQALGKVFPRVVACEMQVFGISGSHTRASGICTLPINVVNEKIYLVLWLAFVMASLLSLVQLVHQALLVSPPLRPFILPHLSPSSLTSRQANKLIMRGSYGNMVLLRLISSNCDSSQFSALVQFLVQEQQLEL